MNFFLDMIPPTVTAQEHKVMIRRGRPVFYDTPRLKEARRLYEHALRLNRPDTPLEGALALTVEWYFPSKTHREGALRVTRPDTDNLLPSGVQILRRTPVTAAPVRSGGLACLVGNRGE